MLVLSSRHLIEDSAQSENLIDRCLRRPLTVSCHSELPK
jgi:hypothetical protein